MAIHEYKNAKVVKSQNLQHIHAPCKISAYIPLSSCHSGGPLSNAHTVSILYENEA